MRSILQMPPSRVMLLAPPALLLLGFAGWSKTAAAAPSPHSRIASRGGDTGIGVSLGDPMGLSVKHFMHPKHALQFHVAWVPLHNFDGGGEFDNMWTPGVFISNRTFDFMPYLGLGVGVGFDRDNAGLMLKPPVGLTFHWKDAPFDTALEGTWSPYWIYGPPTRIELAHGDISIKGRFYF